MTCWPTHEARRWKDDSPGRGRGWEEVGLLGILLFVDSLLAVVVARLLPFCAPNQEYLLDGIALAQRHRIYGSFLPVGYSALLGVGVFLGGQSGVAVMSVGLSLLLIVAAWFYLRLLGASVRGTFVITALLSIYPDFLLSLHKAQETAITAAFLFAFVSLLLKATEKDRFGAVDVGLALTLSGAVMVRPNLLLLVGICWLVFWRLRTPQAVSRLLLQLLLLGICCVGLTTAVHGRPFLPQYGPYNLCSGFNEWTLDFPNEEDSLFWVLPAHGVKPPHGEASFTTENLRDPSLNPIYTQLALQFVREHPWRSVEFMGWKFWDLMQPGTDAHVHPARSVGGAVKILEGLGVPMWVLAMVLLPHPGPSRVKYILAATVALYIVPFLFTVSSSRFRVPLDFLCWVDLCGMVWAWRMRSAVAARRSLQEATAVWA